MVLLERFHYMFYSIWLPDRRVSQIFISSNGSQYIGGFQWSGGAGTAEEAQNVSGIYDELTETCGPFFKDELTLNPAWISNHMPSKVWDEITLPFWNFNGYTVEVWNG